MDPIDNPKGRTELLKLAQQGAITTLYLYFGDFNPDKEPEYVQRLEEFLKEAHQRNLKVEALTGSPVWSLKEYHQACLDWIESFLKYNKSRPQELRIDGVSLDVEPYLTSEWQSEKERVKSDYLELLKKVRGLISSYKQDFRFGIAITPFYADLDNGKFEENVLEPVDYVALMDYYDDPNKIIEKAKSHLVLADKMKKKVVIGVETQDLITLKQGERRFTFFEEGWEYMEDALAQVLNKFKDHKSFEGFGMHCDYSYKLLQRGRNAPIKQRPPVDKIYHIYSFKKTKPIKMDGTLDGWDLSKPYIIDKKVNVVHGIAAWGGPKDLSAAVYSMWDDDNLYFAFDITDDKIVQEKTGPDMWEGDHIEMWFDMNLMIDYYEAIPSNDDFQFGLSPGNFKKLPPEVYLWIPELNMDYKSEIQIASSKTDHGYILEVRVPACVLYASKDKAVGVDPKKPVGIIGQPLDEKQSYVFKKGDKFGVSADPSDCDDPAAPQKVLMSSSVDRMWGDPTIFGALELE